MNKPLPSGEPTGTDPWAIFGYLLAGVAFYGGIGWGLSIWLHATFWIPVGLLVGLGMGFVLVFNRYRIDSEQARRAEAVRQPPDEPPDSDQGDTS